MPNFPSAANCSYRQRVAAGSGVSDLKVRSLVATFRPLRALLGPLLPFWSLDANTWHPTGKEEETQLLRHLCVRLDHMWLICTNFMSFEGPEGSLVALCGPQLPTFAAERRRESSSWPSKPRYLYVRSPPLWLTCWDLHIFSI